MDALGVGCKRNSDTPADDTVYTYVEIIETEIGSLCRICGNAPEEEHLVDVYPEVINEGNTNFAETIMTYLPIKLSRDDILPVKICPNCNEMILRWHNFYECCVEADKKFQMMLFDGKDPGHEDAEVLKNVVGVGIPKKSESEEVFDDMAVSSIAKAEYEVPSDENFDAYTETESEPEINIETSKNRPQCQHIENIPLGCNSKMQNEFSITAAQIQKREKDPEIQYKTCSMSATNFVDECQICGETFWNKASLRKHIATHQNFTCYDCNKSFKNESSLKAHMKLHLGLNPKFACPICGLSMNRKYNMLIHVSSHNADFPCKVCCASFNSVALLDHHKLTHSPEEIEEYSQLEHKVECNSCEVLFDSKYKLYMHNLAEHSADMKKVICHCGRIFETEVMLTNHQKSHIDAMYACNICNKKFKQLKGLDEHQNTHLDNRPYQCEICAKKFRYSSNLSQHRTMHKGVKNFTCPECGKKFLRSNTLATHLRSHKNIRKHVCQHCSASFIQSSSLLKHKRSMHRSCDRCGKMVGNRTEWQIHVWKKCADTPEDRVIH